MPLVARSARQLLHQTPRLLEPGSTLLSNSCPAAAFDASFTSMSRASAPQNHAANCGCGVCRSSSSTHVCSSQCTCPRAAAHSLWTTGSSTNMHRAFSAAKEEGSSQKEESSGAQEEKPKSGEESTSQTEGAETEELNVQELLEKLKKSETTAETTTEQVSQLTDSLKRSLAEMENLRMRTTREVENAKKFAIQSFLKNILDVADNLERAYGAVPPDALSEEEGKALDAARLRNLLKGMMGGVATTEKIFLQALSKEGVQQYNPEGEKFDPNFHNALFEMVDPSKEPGQIGQVTKRGYTLHDRVIRPAEVGVVRGE
ncbi:GrpE-domain-containing protein [Dunaliella salina]|uniref:GrpE protein homolog n=1 Tax=Dunaliella salina TaxID=3046 RepID=A0ABQ7H404_DUNSA|nr:GrpE-domain-containing protein [Dunaliella salina]|eukprot:KAF5841589.1 GrpE-domain-containing protein [Dunaliella salina]